MFKLSAALLFLTLPLLSVLGIGAVPCHDSDYSDDSQLTLDWAAPPLIPCTPAIHRIHPGYCHHDNCVDVKAGVFQSGTPVQIYHCNGTPAQNWYLQRGSTKVRVAGQNFCLDAGSPPFYNGRRVHIYECVNNRPGQQWVYGNDDRIRLQGGWCLDLTGGSLSDGNPLQIWQCTDGNPNQIWIADL